jgi:hypothetical protein
MAALNLCVETLGRTPQVLAAIGVTHALAGRVAGAHQSLAEMEAQAAHRYVGSFFPAQVHVALGEYDVALMRLEAALEERVHWLASLHLDPTVAALRGLPRFEALIARVREGG